MKRRLICMALVVIMLISMLPQVAFAATIKYNENSYSTRITLTDTSGGRVTGATVTVTRGSDTHEVVEGVNGQYYYSRRANSRWDNYTITVSSPNHETKTATMRGNSSYTTIQLTPHSSEFAAFRVYYIADGRVPNTGYAGSNDPIYYGPSADDTPLCLVNVDIAKLRRIAAEPDSPVVYKDTNTSSNNKYEFLPVGTPQDADFMDKLEAFWEAVLTCIDSQSLEDFKETGLFEDFIPYCLKKQSGNSLHMDGILSVTPPVYVVELYQNEVYFGGGVTDSEENRRFLTAYDILDQYEAHLKQTITWVENEYGKPALNDKNQYTGTYVDPATNKIHNIAVFQTNTENTVYVEGSEIPYSKQADTYYLAQYNMSVDAGTVINFLITYTDGVDTEAIFNEHEYAAKRGQTVPAYTGVTIREDYDFVGWYLEGSDGSKVYTDADIAKMTVSRDMVFHAVWQPVPKYTGTVKVVINGTYDAQTQTLTSGTLADIEVPLKLEENSVVYLSTDEKTYIPLTKDGEGTYSASLKNGVYYAYYKSGENYVKISNQPLIMENADRTRYLFYNTVYHDLNGGTLEGSSENILEYFHSGEKVVSGHHHDPEREGYAFTGWQTNDGRLLKTGDVVTESIDRAYVVTAQWQKVADVYVHVSLDHYAEDGETFNVDEAKHDIAFTLDARKQGDADYTEISRYAIAWDGMREYTDEKYSYSYISSGDKNITVYEGIVPLVTDVAADCEYTATSNKSGYMVKNVYQETDENGDIHVYFTMQFDPTEFDFTYSVVLDEKAKTLDKSLWPRAVNVKVTSYAYGEWYPITEHSETYERIELDANGEGTGYYPVWAHSTSENPENYHYRIEVVSYELQNGSIVLAEDIADANTTYEAVDKSYISKIEITGGEAPEGADLDGAYYNGEKQVGTVKAVVSIPVYTVTFIPNGGSLNGSYANTVLVDQIIMPNVNEYVPDRSGGYIFEGWYLYEEGHMTETPAVSGSALTSDVTLIAKWREPLTIDGTVSVAATYEIENEDGSISTHTIHDVDRPTSVNVLLQKKTPAGYYETVDYRTITVDYSNSYYYFTKPSGLTVPVGVGWYTFMGIPDDGSEYRIYVLSANYTSKYQNEPESLTALHKYDTYTEFDYDALLGEKDEKEAVVNAHLHFLPPSFDLLYKIDTTQIGEGFAPDSVDVSVTYDSDPAVKEPWRWSVISQMILDGKLNPNKHEFENGIANGTESVWKYSYDGSTLYDYGINVISGVKDGVTADVSENNPYYEIVYQAPAHFVTSTGKQSQLLVATFVPKTYNIRYETNGGIITGEYVNKHVCSFETTLTDIYPTKEGYVFMGWYKDEQLTQPLDTKTLAPDFCQDVTYYAKWQQVMDKVSLTVTVDHTTLNDGLDQNFDKDLTVTLARRAEDTQDDFIQIAEQNKNYTAEQLNFVHEDVDTFTDELVFDRLSGEFDYNLFAVMDGYYVDAEKSSVTKEVNEDGSATHHVTIYLKYSPELLNLNFTVKVEEGMHKRLVPLFADVKVTCFDVNNGEYVTITQHASKVVDVEIDRDTGIGTGTYPVWQWYDKEENIPYYYRIEVVSLELPGGDVLPLNETETETVYNNGGYTATVYAENGCEKPEGSEFAGAYGVAVETADAQQTTEYDQVGELTAVISAPAVTFHANNKEADCYDDDYDTDVFRTYFPAEKIAPIGEYYNMTAEGKIAPFYEIPTFEYFTHNEYIFKGWYTAPDESGEPIDWDTVYSENTDIYAHWIEVTDVAKDAEDEKVTGSDTYAGFDLMGVQIRNAAIDEMAHYGNPASGLRFISVLSEDVYSRINAIAGNEGGAEYGFAVAKTDSANKMATGENYAIEYCGTNVNGKDTSYDYRYVRNMKCSGVVDHYDGENYRLFTAVITYNGLEGDALESAYATPFVARSYIRYNDANGLYRTYYNNYTGTQLYSSMNTSFAAVRDIVEG